MHKQALIVGATGLIGSKLLKMLLQSANYDKIYAISRKPLSVSHDKLEVVLADYDTLPGADDNCWKVDDVFCCLGTTMKQAGSKEAFRKIDHDYPLVVAQRSKEAGAQAYHLITAMGADSGSMFFYNQVKGDVERDIGLVDFECFYIYRPSLLIGDRGEKRVGERIAIGFSKAIGALMVGPLKKYKGINVFKVARAMYLNAQKEQPGQHIIESDKLQNYTL